MAYKMILGVATRKNFYIPTNLICSKKTCAEMEKEYFSFDIKA